MCTVTYVPTQDNDFIFTSNRDEAPKRSAIELAKTVDGSKEIFFPRDAKAKGTWIAISNKNQLVCILNGAFVKHKRNLPYRMSRGKMALEFFSFKDADAFFSNFEFEGLEPFTMIIFDNGDLYEFRWDELEKHIKKLDAKAPHLWASCTLYSNEWQEKRQKWFLDWQTNNPIVSQSTVLDFHKNAGEGNSEFDVVMNRQNIVRTTSVTSISKEKENLSIRYEDILNETVASETLKIHSI